MCVTCLLKLKPFLFSQQNVWLFKPIYNIEIHIVNTPHQKQQYQAMQTIEMSWFNILNFL
jgi:hypothetical protein